MLGRYIRIAFVFLATLIATPSLAANDGAFLRTQGFGINYGLIGETDSGPKPPEFHLDLTFSTIFKEGSNAITSGPVVATYVQRTVEKVFAKLMGTDETHSPYAEPAFRLMHRRHAH